MRNKKLLLTFTLVFPVIIQNHVIAQEQLLPLIENSEIKSLAKTHNVVKRDRDAKAVIELPFLDDFSTTTGYPNINFWADRYAYINKHNTVSCKTIGIATLDAINAEGELYKLAYGQVYRSADTLTSQPINLQYAAADSIYLSFFYLKGGLVDMPDPADSLIVDFLNIENKWVKMLAMPGGGDNSKWLQTMISIAEEQFLHANFQFRFRNIISPSSGGIIATNCDFWHLDYVRLDKNRNLNDTIIKDVAFTRPPNTVLADFSSIPWRHYTQYAAVEYGRVDFYFTNHDNVTPQNITSYYKVSSTTSSYADSVLIGANNYSAFEDVFISQPVNRNLFPSTQADTAEFLVETKITTSSIYPTYNKKAGRIHKFSNYYAYDDGSSENGYDVNVSGGQVAVKYETYIPDSLRGVYIYFNTTNDSDAASNFFNICVWANDGGLPGQLIYSKYGNSPVIDNKFGMQYISFDSAIYMRETFFIGWSKSTPKHLSVGYDLNTTTLQKNYYNMGTSWLQSTYRGGIMIRPVFSQNKILDIDEQLNWSEENKPFIYPVPASEILYLSYPDHYREWKVYVADIMGRIVYEQIRPASINITRWLTGIYIATIENNREKYHVKLIIK